MRRNTGPRQFGSNALPAREWNTCGRGKLKAKENTLEELRIDGTKWIYAKKTDVCSV